MIFFPNDITQTKRSAKKVLFSGQSTKRGGGEVKGCPLRKFLKFVAVEKLEFKTKKKFFCPLSRGDGGLKALVDSPLKKITFFAASLSMFNLSITLNMCF